MCRIIQALCHLSSIPPTLRSFILNPSAGSSSHPTNASTNPDPADVDLAQSSQAPPPASQLHNPPPRNSSTLLGNRTGSDLSKQAEDGAEAVARRSAAAAVAWKACPAPLALKKGLEMAYNESQLAAVASALDESSPISLVQVCLCWNKDAAGLAWCGIDQITTFAVTREKSLLVCSGQGKLIFLQNHVFLSSHNYIQISGFSHTWILGTY